MNFLPAKIAYIIVSSALFMNSQAEASFMEHQLKQQKETLQQRKKREETAQQKRQEAQAFLKTLVQRAVSESSQSIENHVLSLHGIGVEQISSADFDNRKYYSLFDRNHINSVEAFQAKVNELLDQNPVIKYDGTNYHRKIKIILESNTELGRYFTEDNYNSATHMKNIGHANDPLLAGKPGMKLVLIIDTTQNNIFTHIRDMMNGKIDAPHNTIGYGPTVATAFLEQ